MSRKEWWESSPVASETDDSWWKNAPKAEESKEVDPGWWASKFGRFVQGAAEPVVGAAQLAANVTGVGSDYMNRKAKEGEEFYQASRRAAGLSPSDWDYWAGAGNMATTLAPGVGMGLRGAGLAGAAARSTGMGAMAARGAASGAGMAAAQPVADVSEENPYAGQKIGQIIAGGATGALAGPAGHFIGEAMVPSVTPEAQKMMAEGWKPTIGQMFGPESNIKRMEDIGEKVPILGSWIRDARERSLESYNRVAVDRALKPIGQSLPEEVGVGHEAFTYAEKQIGKEYDRLHQHVTLKMDDELTNDLQTIMLEAKTLPAQQRQQLQDIILDQIDDRLANNKGILPGHQVQNTTGELGRLTRTRIQDQNADIKDLGWKLQDVRNAVDDALERQNPEHAEALRNANKAWSHLIRLEDATKSTTSAARFGAFTPQALSVAAGKKGSSRLGARGENLYQDLAEAGKRLIPSNVASSGTAEREQTMKLLGTVGLGGGAGYTLGPLPAAAALAIPALYSQPGQAMARSALSRGLLGQQNKEVADLLRAYGPQVLPALTNQYAVKP